jgi:phospholipase/lecithinase/hemolysin
MKRNLNLIQRMRLPALAGLVLLSMAVADSRAQAKSDPFSHLMIFGDSLSDTGNYFRLSGGSPPAPYADGRFCNGPIWVEYLSTQLGMDYQPADNFAVGGATTGTLNSNDGFAGKQYPGLLDEIATFQASAAISEPERALYVVEAGANDFFVALATQEPTENLIADGVNNTVSAIQRLWASGARVILVMNVPDLGVTPMAKSIGMGPQLTGLCAAYNQVLGQALDNLVEAGIPTIRLDAFRVLSEMANTPAAYGFSNVSLPFLLAPAGSSPHQFLFWDPVHPTTGAHEVLAEEAVAQLLAAFSPSKGNGKPEAKINGLNGLVNASLHRR